MVKLFNDPAQLVAGYHLYIHDDDSRFSELKLIAWCSMQQGNHANACLYSCPGYYSFNYDTQGYAPASTENYKSTALGDLSHCQESMSGRLSQDQFTSLETPVCGVAMVTTDNGGDGSDSHAIHHQADGSYNSMAPFCPTVPTAPPPMLLPPPSSVVPLADPLGGDDVKDKTQQLATQRPGTAAILGEHIKTFKNSKIFNVCINVTS